VTLTAAFQRELERRGGRADGAQLVALSRLEELRGKLHRAARRERRWLWQLRAALSRMPPRRPIRGLYLWGSVGRGKTLLLDLFAATLEVPAARSHFHRFMQDVHARLGRLREAGVEQPLARIAADYADLVRVLCFDELYVSDIADAMLLGGLFEGLIARGVTLVFTSNVPPAGLYPGALQRARFLPTIALLERATAVLEVDGGTDYRLRQLERAPLYVGADAEDSDRLLQQRFEAIAGSAGEPGGMLAVEGREIPVRRRAAGIVWFDFAALCAGPRSTADYIEIARQHHTVVVAGVPSLGAADEDAARRFIAVVDEFYERGVKLVLSAVAAPEQLYRGLKLAAEFRRTASRLTEMQTHDYLARAHRP
jgi:cell division protein ZapE